MLFGLIGKSVNVSPYVYPWRWLRSDQPTCVLVGLIGRSVNVCRKVGGILPMGGPMPHAPSPFWIDMCTSDRTADATKTRPDKGRSRPVACRWFVICVPAAVGCELVLLVGVVALTSRNRVPYARLHAGGPAVIPEALDARETRTFWKDRLAADEM